jgi:signal transduction histidine kinase
MTSRGRSIAVPITLVLFGGAALTAFVATGESMSGEDTFQIVVLAAGIAAIAGIAGVGALTALRTRSLAVQAASLILVVVVSLGLGVWIGAAFMFISGRDLAELAIMLAAAGSVAIVTALVLGWRVGNATTALVEAARRLGEGQPMNPTRSAPAEFERLARELDRAALRLEDARRREAALEQSRRELVAWVSHDLRTPLAGIRAIAEALEDGIAEDAATVTSYHATLCAEAERLSDLVDDLFELSRTQAGVVRLQLQHVSWADLISDTLAGVAPVAEAKGVQLVGRVDDAPSVVNVSPPEVVRALRNVLENAVRHTPSDGTVIVEAGAEDDRAYVSVLDHGGGIPERDLGRVFEVAFRGDPARTPGTAGAGLGLAIARGLVEAHDGDISVQNEDGGCRFTLRLPLRSA